ncbi:MAG TPA: aspartyl-phosphate phosphatase Spo0E family protein [Ureibacillus sp.]|nr:aspartyl-phosphate phosphatase Spo0E family protein [Ureibacillus sp.]
MKTTIFPPEELQLKIEVLRSDMIATAQLKGLTHPDTIKLSKELDDLLNEHQKNQIEMPLIIF